MTSGRKTLWSYLGPGKVHIPGNDWFSLANYNVWPRWWELNSRSLCRVHLFRFMAGETKQSILDVLKAAVVHALTRTWLRTWNWTCPISSKLLSPNQNLTEKMTWTCPISSKLWVLIKTWLRKWPEPAQYLQNFWVLIKTWLRKWPEPAVYPEPPNTGFLTAADSVDDLHWMPCLGERLKLCKCGSAILLYFLLRLSKTQVVLITYMLWFATVNLLMTPKKDSCSHTPI